MRCAHGYETGHRLQTEGKTPVLDLLPRFPLGTRWHVDHRNEEFHPESKTRNQAQGIFMSKNSSKFKRNVIKISHIRYNI